MVDDVPDVLDILREALDDAGFDIDTAATPTEALDRLATRPYKGIIADCISPGLPVLDWLAALRGAAPGGRRRHLAVPGCAADAGVVT